MDHRYKGPKRSFAATSPVSPAIPFIHHLASSGAFKDLFREGMTLVEEAASVVITPQKRVEIILRAFLIGADEFLEHRAPRGDRLGRREQASELIFVDVRIARDLRQNVA